MVTQAPKLTSAEGRRDPIGGGRFGSQTRNRTGRRPEALGWCHGRREL